MFRRCSRSAYRFESISGASGRLCRSAYRFESISGASGRLCRSAYRFESISGASGRLCRSAYRFESIRGTLHETGCPAHMSIHVHITIFNCTCNWLITLYQVISWISTLLSWSPQLKSRIFIARDQFDCMISTLSTDALITERTPGIGRRVRLWFT